MTIRWKIADWISGGVLSAATIDAANARLTSYKRWMALTDIAAQETKGANATVKRMAKIAREGIKNDR